MTFPLSQPRPAVCIPSSLDYPTTSQDEVISEPLVPGENYTTSQHPTVPSLPPGDYYLVLNRDYHNTLYESDEDNNILARDVAICARGDANMDGIIDGRDVIRCKKIILGLQEGTCGADANQDTVIDGWDVIRIKKMILGID